MSEPVVDLDVIRRRTAQAAAAASGDAEPGVRDLTHDGLALALGDDWADEGRHVAAWGRWYFFDGSVWREDEMLEHMTRARAFLRARASELPLESEATARRLRRAETVAKVVGLARSNSSQAAAVDQWDADPYHLGHPDPEDA